MYSKAFIIIIIIIIIIINLCFPKLETAVYWRADKNLGCMDHKPL